MKSDDNAPRQLKDASVLIVEDHTFVLDLLERMLTSKVGVLHSARSAEDAFYNLEKSPGLAHVVVVDYHLLGMNGLKLIEKIRASKSELLKKLPVIMLTSDNNMDLYRSAARLGISSFLIKPAAVATLVEALEGALAGRKVAVPRLDAKQMADTVAAFPSKPRGEKSDSSPSEEAELPVDEEVKRSSRKNPPPRSPVDFKT